MKTLRIAALTSMFAAFGLMTGCDLFGTDSSNESPTITDFRIAVTVGTDGTQSNIIDVTASTQAVVYGKYADDNTIQSVSIAFKDPTGKTVTPTISKTGAAPGGAAWNSNIDGKWVLPTAGLCNGAYTATATVTDNEGATSTATTTFTITGSTTCATTPVGTALTPNDAADLGAQGVTGVGSFLSIVGGWSMTSGEKTVADEDSVDVVFFADASATPVPYFFSPAAAFAANLGNLTGWTIKHNTIIVKSTTALTTVEQVKALTDNSTSHSAIVANDAWYAVKLDNGKYGAIHVTAFSGSGRSATATVSIFKN